MAQNTATDDEYTYNCTNCGHTVETQMFREAVDCPECDNGKLIK